MKKEDLIKLGLSEEHAQAVADKWADEHKEFIPKSRFDEINKDKKHYESEVKRLDTELTEIKKSTDDIDEFKSKVADLQNDLEKQGNKHKAELKQVKVENAIATAGAKRVKSVLSELDLDKISVGEDGELIGLKEQIDGLKSGEETSFLFEAEKPLQLRGANPQGGQSKPPGEIDWKTATYEQITQHLESGGELPE